MPAFVIAIVVSIAVWTSGIFTAYAANNFHPVHGCIHCEAKK